MITLNITLYISLLNSLLSEAFKIKAVNSWFYDVNWVHQTLERGKEDPKETTHNWDEIDRKRSTSYINVNE